MKVENVFTSNQKKRYMVVADDGNPIEPVLQFLKFRDNTGAARNTLRAYSYHLKLYFEFLDQCNLNYLTVNIDDIANFLGWLQMPDSNLKVSYIGMQESNRSIGSVNIIVNTVMIFYEYLVRHEHYTSDIPDKFKKWMAYSKRGYKDFLYHINKDRMFKANFIKLKAPKLKPKILTKDQVQLLVQSCINKRDIFLIRLLWESSMRIGEALGLWIEDFDICATKIYIKDRGELENGSEIKTIHSPRAIDVSAELMNEFMDYIAELHTDEVDTNFVFIKLTGPNKFRPLEYQDVVSLFNRLKKKTGIDANPHMLRHTSLTELRRAGWEAEHLRLRAGHKHFQTTMQMYIHPSDEDLRTDWEKSKEKMLLKPDMKGNV